MIDHAILAEPLHAAALAAIHGAAFPPGERWGADAMMLQLATPGAFGWLDPAGGLVLARMAADEAEVLTLAVLPERSGQGVGRALLALAMATAAGRGASAMFLEVGEGNAPARALYASAGFAEVGRRPRYYPGGVDALVLRRNLSLSAAAGG